MATRTDIKATPIKLRNGDWGARVIGPVQAGDTITIHANNGKSWDAIIVRVIWSKDATSICSTRKPSRQPMGSGHGQVAPVAGYSSYCTDRLDCGCYDCAS